VAGLVEKDAAPASAAVILSKGIPQATAEHPLVWIVCRSWRKQPSQAQKSRQQPWAHPSYSAIGQVMRLHSKTASPKFFAFSSSLFVVRFFIACGSWLAQPYGKL
jgi:hypothetical protein